MGFNSGFKELTDEENNEQERLLKPPQHSSFNSASPLFHSWRKSFV